MKLPTQLQNSQMTLTQLPSQRRLAQLLANGAKPYTEGQVERAETLEDEEDALIDELLTSCDQTAMNDLEVFKASNEKAIQHFNSISRRKNFGEDLGQKNLSRSKLRAAVEDNEILEKVVDDELEYQESLKS